MNKLEVRLSNCYGISNLIHTFDFSNNNMPVAIYAPNGTMKTSLAKSLRDYSQGKMPSDMVFPERPSTCQIMDETGSSASAEAVFVIESINEKYKSDRISSLLASDSLKSDYDAIFASISLKLEALLKKVRKQSGLSKDAETAFSEAFKVNPNAIVSSLARLDREVKDAKNSEFSGIKYKSVFSPKAIEFLQDPEIQVLIGEYTQIYERMIDTSRYFKKGVFNHSNAEVIAKNLKSNGWFEGGHSVNLKHGGTITEIGTEADLVAAIQVEKDQILSDATLVATFNKVEKSISSAELRDLREYLVANPSILSELNDLDQFRQKVWISYLIENKSEYFDLVSEFDASKVRLREIIEAAEQEQTRWEAVVDLFNRRFSVPFEVRVENKSDAILSSKAPQLAFYFKDPARGVERRTSRDDLDQVLSNGEKRALYILNIIFEVEARKSGNIETVFIFDDIADSFDYKNKYAIIEYIADIMAHDKFHVIVLTHNFDFYRTIKCRLNVWGDNRLLCNRNQNTVSLVRDSLSDNPFLHWKDRLNENISLIASIPFVRNLAEYTGNTASYDRLTLLLHLKNGSEAIQVSTLRDEYDRVLMPGSFFDFQRTTDSVIALIESECDSILALNPDNLALEAKIAMSMGIRLMAERVLIEKINNPAVVAAITKNQTNVLVKKYKKLPGANINILATMQKVQLMTPENIHLNSFMYEPILDLSGHHLQSLYMEVKAHLDP